MKRAPASVNAYIAAAPKAARPQLRQLRRIIKAVAPKAEEKISYQMPYYGSFGRLAYFAAFRNHVSFFAMMSRATRRKYARQLQRYQTGKATLQFSFGAKIPVTLVRTLVTIRVKENEAKARTKRE